MEIYENAEELNIPKTQRTNREVKLNNRNCSRGLIAVIVLLVISLVLSAVAIVFTFVSFGEKKSTELNEALERMKTLTLSLNETKNDVNLLKEENKKLLKWANDTETEFQALKDSSAEITIGSDYVRWGRKACGNTSHQLYSGITAGQAYSQTGGAAEYICLPIDPEFYPTVYKNQGNYIYGTEYETVSGIFPNSMKDQNAPCARCYVPDKSVTIMIPAKLTCPPSWTKEYEGYLMSGYYTHARAYNYICVDKEPEALDGLEGSVFGAALYFVRVHSYLGRCPPYECNGELACVVCSK